MAGTVRILLGLVAIVIGIASWPVLLVVLLLVLVGLALVFSGAQASLQVRSTRELRLRFDRGRLDDPVFVPTGGGSRTFLASPPSGAPRAGERTCAHCGAEVGADAAFCTRCGQALR